MKKALITGITGQDGSYLTDLLLGKGYEVHGMVRRTSAIERSRLEHLHSDPEIYGKTLFLHYAELDDPTTLRRTLNAVRPHEMYHLAGQSHVGLSFEIPESTCDTNGMATLRILEMLRDMENPPRFMHASTSEIFGRPKEVPQTEETPMVPTSPYACAKAFATQMVRLYREAYGLFCLNCICYNHESPRRGENFVTRKICKGAAEVKAGLRDSISLGNISAQRDWGDARIYVHGMHLTLQQEKPEDFILATGSLHSVEDVLEAAFRAVDLDWRDHVETDERMMRASEPGKLIGDSSKARRILGWEPGNPFTELIREMTKQEYALLSEGRAAS